MPDHEPFLAKDLYRFNSKFNELELDEAEARYQHLLERKERLTERTTFGLLALNSGSIVAGFTAIGSPEFMAAVGISASTIAFSIAAFLVGMMLALAAIQFDSNKLTQVSGVQFVRVSHLRILASLLSSELSPDNENELAKAIKKLDEVQQADFDVSHFAIAMLHFSGGAWLAGALAFFWQVVQKI